MMMIIAGLPGEVYHWNSQCENQFQIKNGQVEQKLNSLDEFNKKWMVQDGRIQQTSTRTQHTHSSWPFLFDQ